MKNTTVIILPNQQKPGFQLQPRRNHHAGERDLKRASREIKDLLQPLHRDPDHRKLFIPAHPPMRDRKQRLQRYPDLRGEQMQHPQQRHLFKPERYRNPLGWPLHFHQQSVQELQRGYHNQGIGPPILFPDSIQQRNPIQPDERGTLHR